MSYTLSIDMSAVRSREDFLAALDDALAALPPADRARAGRYLADRSTGAHLREGTDALVHQLTRDDSYPQVARMLGVAEPTVAKAVKRYNAANRVA
jgi:hypothetical protein